MRVLQIEDRKEFSDKVMEELGRLGINHILATTYESAVERLSKEGFDYVIMEIFH